MPVLNTIRPTREVTLPESGGKVSLYTQFLTGDYRKLMENEKIDPNNMTVGINQGIGFVLCLIADWDFTDGDGNKLAVDTSTLDMLPISDLNVLSEYVAEATKNSTVDPSIKKNI